MYLNEKELANLYKTGGISRREFLRMATLVGLSASSVSTLLAACAPKPTAEPTKVPVVPTEAPAEPTATSVPPTEVAEIGPKRGGILKHAVHPSSGNFDPAFLSNVADDEIAQQFHDKFVYLDDDAQPDPDRSLAMGWESNEDGTVWIFELREGVTFHNGKDLTAKDVVFTYNRLCDPDIGAPTVSLYANIKEIEALDDYHIRFTLETTNPDLPLDLGEPYGTVVDSDVEDFTTNFNGTGPFMIETYLLEDRIVFKRNPNYWMADEGGHSLPYLDGMEFIFLAEASAQVEALRGGQVHWINYLPPEYVETIEADPDIEIAVKTGNFHYVIHMRSDRPPANDNRVRQALKLATDRSALLESAALGYGVSGRDTPIGPVYGDYYLDVPEPKRDIEKAKALLAEAGYPDGLEIELVTPEIGSVPGIATVWKEQIAEAGITANVRLSPIDFYYGSGEWLECDFGITDWAGRSYPQIYLQLAYQSESSWNESHFQDEELDMLIKAAGQEMDHARRVELYHEIQEIFIERGPIIVPFFMDSMLAYRSDVKPGITMPFLAAIVDLRRVWLEES